MIFLLSGDAIDPWADHVRAGPCPRGRILVSLIAALKILLDGETERK
jgi:hypothetical protein